MDSGHLSLGKVQYHAPATNISHYNYTKMPIVRSQTPDYTGCSKSSKVKRNKSSAADTYLYRAPETRRLLSERKFQLNRSNPNLWECSEEPRQKWGSGRERRSGSHPSLAPPLRGPLPAPMPAPRAARSTTWCCGTFVKQLTKSHHFD